MSSEDEIVLNFINKFMENEQLKGKKNRILLTAIQKKVGFSEEKMKTAYLRATLAKRCAVHEK